MRVGFNILLTLLVSTSFLFVSCSADTYLEHPQNKLLSVLEKDTIRIAFLGGSITNGAGASSYQNSWVSQLEDHLKKDFNKEIQSTNLGIGASNSEFGVYRFEHVLAFKPHLLVVEFAVNDDHMDSSLTSYNHEQLYLLAKKHDIAFLSINLNKADNISNYRYIAPVLTHHKLPNVRVKMSNEDLMDGVHPSDEGHDKISTAILGYLKNLSKVENTAQQLTKSRPLKNVSADLAILDTNKWKKSAENFYYLSSTRVNHNKYDTSSFYFSGSRFGLSVMLRGKNEPQNGTLNVKVGNKPWTTITCLNESPYTVVKTHTLASDLENGKHLVKIVTVPDTLPDGVVTKKWEIVSVLTAE